MVEPAPDDAGRDVARRGLVWQGSDWHDSDWLGRARYIAFMARIPPRSESTGPLAIGRVMGRLLARAGYAGEQAADGLAEAWRQACPEAFRGRSQPGLVRRGVLEVFLRHSALVQEFGFHKRDVLEQLQRLLPAAGIADIRCRVLPDAGSDAG